MLSDHKSLTPSPTHNFKIMWACGVGINHSITRVAHYDIPPYSAPTAAGTKCSWRQE